MIPWLLALTLLSPLGLFMCADLGKVCGLAPPDLEAIFITTADMGGLPYQGRLIYKHVPSATGLYCAGPYRRDEPDLIWCDAYLELRR